MGGRGRRLRSGLLPDRRGDGSDAEGLTDHRTFQEITTWDHTKSAPDLQDAVDNIGSHGAFPFVRIEDADYDHRAGVPSQKPAIYFVDTGNGVTTGRVAGKVNATCNGVCDNFGSIYRVQFDPADPTSATLTLLARSRGVAAGDWASPDNVAAGKKSLMVQEDPAYPEFNRPERIWDFQFNADGTLAAPQAVVELTTEQQTGKVCSDAAGTCWESSGIIDASEWLGAGTWLFDVHTLPIFKVKSDGSYELGADGQPLKLTNNESGQLLYLRVPGT